MKNLYITVTRLHSGISLSAIADNRLIRRLYIGYSLTEAKRLFKEYIRAM